MLQLLLILNVQLKQQNDLDKTMVFKSTLTWQREERMAAEAKAAEEAKKKAEEEKKSE